MSKITTRLTVYFENPFWVGLYERIEGEQLEAARVIFGPEPKNDQVYDYFNRRFSQLQFSPAVPEALREKDRVNPKRRQREIRRQLQQSSPAGGTKSQQALKLLQEQNKQARKERRKGKKEAEKERQFQLKQQKKKEKHRGH